MSTRLLSTLAAGLLVLVAGCSGGGDSADAGTTTPPASTQQSASAPPSAGGVERYEEYLHALGRQDVAQACEIAAPAAKKAEDQGLGPCEQTFPLMFQMISPAQKRALQTASVDPARVVERSATGIEIPAAAVRAATTFTDSDLGDATLEYRNGQWYVTD